MPSEVSRPTWRPSRRAVLTAAVAGGGAAAGVRLVFGQPEPKQPPKAGTAQRADWPAPADQERTRMAQLLRRATWGVTAESLDTALHEGFARTVDRLIDSPPAEPKVSPIATDDPTRGATQPSEDYQRWWLTHILNTPTPFAEKMTYFWHGHFTSDYDKGGTPFVYWQNLTWRKMAFGHLREMLHKVTLDPAMLNYLDLSSSDASDPAVPPNENYARELMELFTMGPGTHSERDVKAAARALAGWSAPEPDGQVEVVTDEKTGSRETFDFYSGPKAGYFDSSKAHDGIVTFLGRTGRLQLNDVIDQILAQPVTAEYIARRVAVHFISPKPAAETVKQIADAYRATDYDTRTLMRAAFMSPEFSAPSSYRSLVRSPVEFMVAASLALRIPAQPAADMIIGHGDPAGQNLFQPPNVAGWPPNARWISPGMLLGRFNFISELIGGEGLPAPHSSRGADAVHLDGVIGSGTSRRLGAAHDDHERWLAITSAPEFHLK